LKYAELVYYAQWFHPLREALQTFMDHTNATVTGIAKVRLFKGRAMAVNASSPHSLMTANSPASAWKATT
jgi:argininosuccinate synthase